MPPDNGGEDPGVPASESRPTPASLHRLLQEKGSDDESVERRGPEGFDGIARGADDRLTAGIERGVDEHRHPGAPAESSDEIVIERMIVAPDGLDARRPIHMSDGRDIVGAV